MTNQTDGPPSSLSPEEAKQLVSWYQVINQLMGNRLSSNPFDAQHNYNYAAAFKAGAWPSPTTGHWPSQFKTEGHPNRFVPQDSGGFWDTLTNQTSPTNPNQQDPLLQILMGLLQ